ncbi:MAG: discoidin domain-containing protein [Phycisphaerales bacterium]
MRTDSPPRFQLVTFVWFAVFLIPGIALAQSAKQLDTWVMQTSHDGVEAELHEHSVRSGFVLDYNFKAGAGYVIARHVFDPPIDLPENYEITFDLRASGPPNDLEVKLLDAGDGQNAKLGDSVWWIKRRNFEWPKGEARITNKAKRFQFAWGPLNGAMIRKLGGVEIVVASSSGGKGSIFVGNAELTPLPPTGPYVGNPTVTASSARADHPALMAVDDDPKTAWLDDEATPPEFTIDFGALREFDALRIDWASPTGDFRVVAADAPGERWRTLWYTNNTQSQASRSYVDVPDTTARLIRVYPSKKPGTSAGISELKCLMRPETSAAENLGVWSLIAADQPPETMPRYFTGRQSTWTVLGAPGSEEETLINEEGDIELFHSGPMLSTIVSFEDHGNASIPEKWTGASQRMDVNGVPTAEVTRAGSRCTLTTRAFCTSNETLVLYTLKSQQASRGSLLLCLRPFQVDPPWQFLNAPGGLARVRSIAEEPNGWLVNGSHRVTLPVNAATAAALPFDAGEAASILTSGGTLPRTGRSIEDPRGAASAAASCVFDLTAGQEQSWLVRIPSSAAVAPLPRGDAALFEQLRSAERANWAAAERFSIALPPGNEQLAASIKASLAYILINKDGPGFQPGSRSYERSWIRDGALTSAALLEFGLIDDVKRFIDWYAGYQFPTGGIPCVVDTRGADPVTENDSHGQFIYALAEYHRYTHDDAFALKHFGEVEKAVAHIQSERAKRMTAEFQGDSTKSEPHKPAVPLKAFYGLMPESISHEGYSSKPMHSYWDDFFTLKGLRDAAYLARALKKDDQAKAFQAAADDMAACIKRSIELTQKAHGIGYIPGCVELGDFDATSTTIAINPCGAIDDLPRTWYDATFSKWWDFFEARRDNRIDWVDYTPYEWRIVGTLIMLGQRERAWESTKWYMQDQNPPRKPGDTSATGWLHWAEIVHKDRGAGKWIGDMPHTWVASDFLRSVRTMFVYEEPAPIKEQSSLVLFAGIPAEWADAPGGVSFTGLRTPYGPIDASLKKLDDGRYELRYSGLERTPYRVRLAPPVAWPPKQIEILEGGGAANDKQGGLDGITTGMTIRFR